MTEDWHETRYYPNLLRRQCVDVTCDMSQTRVIISIGDKCDIFSVRDVVITDSNI